LISVLIRPYSQANMATTHAQTEVDAKDRFFRQFRNEVTGRPCRGPRFHSTELTQLVLTEQIDRLNSVAPNGGERNDAIDHCLAGIDRLSHEVKDAAGYIPAYDQRTYGEVSPFQVHV
jgi:hypothetical protein